LRGLPSWRALRQFVSISRRHKFLWAAIVASASKLVNVSWQKQATATGRAQIRKTTEEGRNRCTALTPGDLEMIGSFDRKSPASRERWSGQALALYSVGKQSTQQSPSGLRRCHGTVEHACRGGTSASLRWPRGWATPNLCNHDLVVLPPRLPASQTRRVHPCPGLAKFGWPTVGRNVSAAQLLSPSCLRNSNFRCVLFFFGGEEGLSVWFTESHFAQ
jgi:hypothetical protein